MRVPKLGWVNMTEARRFSGKILKAVITQDKVGDWYAAISVEVHHVPPPNLGHSTGLDLGISRLATLSNGTGFENQKHLAQAENKLKRLQRSLSRKHGDSRRWEKARIRVAKAHREVQRMRWDTLHKLTTHLATHYRFIGIENLNLKGMVRNRKLAKALSDAALGVLVDLLISKCARYGAEVQPVGRFFPSSQLCSRCGHQKSDLTLRARVFVCPKCSLEMDRDWNAARNIEKEALRLAGYA
jgi:putative transposase